MGVEICIYNRQSRGLLNKKLINALEHKFREILDSNGSGGRTAAQEMGVLGFKVNMSGPLSYSEFISLKEWAGGSTVGLGMFSLCLA